MVLNWGSTSGYECGTLNTESTCSNPALYDFNGIGEIDFSGNELKYHPIWLCGMIFYFCAFFILNKRKY